MKRKFMWLALLLIVTMLLAACTAATPTEAPPTPEPSGAEPTEPAPEPEPTGPFRVAVVMPSATNDLAFSQSMYDALLAIESEMGAGNFEFAFSETLFIVDDAAAAIRD